MDIYGQFGPRLHDVLTRLTDQIEQLSHQEVAAGRPKLYEHLIGRVKTPASMAEKCQRKGFAVSTHAAPARLPRCRRGADRLQFH